MKERAKSPTSFGKGPKIAPPIASAMSPTILLSIGKIRAMFVESMVLLLRGWKLLISPLFGPCCRFYPSCSDYMAQAIREHGVGKGLSLGLKRLLRCNSLCQGGLDPVPVGRPVTGHVTEIERKDICERS